MPLSIVTLRRRPVPFAHGIDLEWKQINDRFMVEAFFDDDTPVREARVRFWTRKRTSLPPR